MDLLLEETSEQSPPHARRARARRRRRRIHWSDLGLQAGLITIAALLYFGVRYVTTGSQNVAIANARRILDLEALLGIDVEQSIQAAVVSSRAIVTLSNWVYMWAHLHVIIFTFAWLYFRAPSDYARFRNALFVSGAVGLVVFALFPVAPPRLLHDGFVDTITEWSTSYRVLQPPSLVNEYAAVPSFHVGWNLLAAIFLARNLGRMRWRYIPYLSPFLMTLAVVFTANHYVLDAVAGALVATLGLWAGWRLAHPKVPLLGTPPHAEDVTPVESGAARIATE